MPCSFTIQRGVFLQSKHVCTPISSLAVALILDVGPSGPMVSTEPLCMYGLPPRTRPGYATGGLGWDGIFLVDFWAYLYDIDMGFKHVGFASKIG